MLLYRGGIGRRIIAGEAADCLLSLGEAVENACQYYTIRAMLIMAVDRSMQAQAPKHRQRGRPVSLREFGISRVG